MITGTLMGAPTLCGSIGNPQTLEGVLDGPKASVIVQGTSFVTDETLSLKDGVLSVNTANVVEEDNTLPVTSAAVHTTVGNIEALLSTI